MLKLFRHKYWKQVLLLPIVGTLALAMLAYLVPGTADVDLRDPQGMVAQVGDLPLTQDEVNQHYQRVAEQFGAQNPAFKQLIMEQLIEDLIGQRLVQYEAARLGLEVSPEEVRLRLRQVPYLYPGGQFVGAETYRQIVERQFRMSVAQFEETLRQQTLVAKMFDWVAAGLTVSSAEVEAEYRRRSERAQIEYVLFRPEEMARSLEPGAEELRAYFEKHRDSYRQPARRAVRYVALDYDTLGQRLRVTQQELQDYYQRNRAAYQTPERVRVRHILFLLRSPEGEAARDPAAVRQQAESALAELRRGKDFAALARQHSDDAGSKEKGGELGWVLRGQTVPALEQAIFSAPPGGSPQLVETGYGLHLVQVLAHEPEQVKPLAEVRNEIERVLKDDKVRREALEQARQLVAAVRAGKTLDQAARQAGWPVLETGLFERDTPFGPFGEGRDFQEAAFALPAETAGQPAARVSEPVAVPPGYAVLQLKQDQPARPATLDEVRAEVVRAWRQERGGELAREAAHRLATQAEQAGDLKAAARKAGAAVKTTGLFARDAFIPELGSARDLAPVVFTLPLGGLSPALPAGGNWVVFRVAARTGADMSKLTDQDRRAARNALLDQKRNLTWTVFQQNLKKKFLAEGKLKLNQAAIDRLKKP